MDPAELVERWDELDRDERLDALEDAVNDMLDRYGYDPVDVVAGEVPGYAVYEDGIVYLDNEYTLEGDSGSRALETGFHEGAHAMEDQDDDLDLDNPDDYNDQSWDFSDTDAAGSPRPTMVDPDHQAIRDFAVAETRAVLDRGSSTGSPASGGGESGAGGSESPDVFSWTDPSGLSFTIDFADAVVTGEGSP